MPSRVRIPETPEQRRQHAIRRYRRQGLIEKIIFCPECSWPVLPLDDGAIRLHTTATGERCTGTPPEEDKDDDTRRKVSIVGQHWRDRALCREYPPQLFDRLTGPDSERAKEICMRCPVIRECLEWVSEDTTYVGVAAGRVWHHDRSITDDESPEAP